jgi:hypothetical protein
VLDQRGGRDHADAKRWPCVCGHAYVAHRYERRQVAATVCSECRCVRFTPRDEHAWNQLLRQLEALG